MLQPPAIGSNRVHVNQRLMNITREMVQRELQRVRDGNARAGFSETNGKLMYADRDARGRQRTREVLALEDRDLAFQRIYEQNKYPGLARFHQLVQSQYAGIGRRKTQWWYSESMNNQLHARMQHRNIVRPVLAARPSHLQIDLTDHTSSPSGAYKWNFNCIDLFSRFLWVEPMRNKEGPTCARAMRAIAERGGFREWATVLQSDNDPSFKSAVFQEAVDDLSLKHIFSKTYTSTSQAKIERAQLSLRTAIGKYITASGNRRWHTVIQELVATYNRTMHSVIRVEPATALTLALQNDQELIEYVRANDRAAALKTMGIDGKPLNVGDRCRVSIFAISSDARRQRGDIGRKASQETNWSRALFTIKTRSKGNELSRPVYTLQELGYGQRRPRFFRHELLGPIDESRLRDDVKPPSSKDTMASLEKDALQAIRDAAEDAKEADVIAKAVEKEPSAESKRFLQANVKRTFLDGTLKGVVARHVMIPVADDQTDDDGERWLIRYENGRQELVRPQLLLDILVGDDEGAKKKEEDVLASDPLIGRTLRSPDEDDPEIGTITSVRLKKPEGSSKKAKRTRHYLVEWAPPGGVVSFTREYQKFEILPFLIPV